MDQSQLLQVESLCQALYQGTSSAQRAEAQQQLLTLQTSADFIPQCQFILDNSKQPYAQVMASTSLEILITQFWNNFTVEQKVEIRNYILNYLATHAHDLQEFVVNSLTKLLCRITKLGWFDSPEHREIIDETTKFLEATVSHHIVGLKILNSLVDEMNTPTLGRTLTVHRKTAVTFRDMALFPTFQISITTLRQLQQQAIDNINMSEKEKMGSLALTLCLACLSFDFIGTNPEESTEDVGTIQVPSSWRVVVQDTSTIQLLFDCYLTSAPPRSSLALQSLVQLSSVRRSLFPSEKDRAVFLQALMSGIQNIMMTKKGLEREENYHEFCRLLGRLKASYQLSELVKTAGFVEWLELAADFTIKSLQNWQYSMNSIHYLLALWGRMVAALPYLRTDASDSQRQAQVLRQSVLQVVESYIKIMLDSVDIVVSSDGGIEDPLEDEGSLKEQMERLPVLARLQFDSVAQYLMSTFEQTLVVYQQLLNSGGRGNNQCLIMEGRMTWLVQMVGAIIGTQSSSDPQKSQTELLWDGRLSRCVFQLIQLIDFQLNNSGGTAKADEKLELAILTFFRSFKKSFLLDTSSSLPQMSIMSAASTPAHPLLSLALSSPSGVDDKDGLNETKTIYDAMGIGDSANVMNVVVNKMCNNIKFWHRSDKILEDTLESFVEMITSYSSSKTLLGLETVNFLVHNHVGAHFPFLGYDNDNKYRITFYSALARLVFSSSEDVNNSFDAFIAPNIEILQRLNEQPDLRSMQMKTAIVGALRDLRGIITSAYNKRPYNLLFDALHPELFPLFVRITETWFDDPVVMTAMFKFLQEFTLNKGQRIQFELSSANGILLFRETSAIVCSYGSRILAVPVQQDIYLEKYKGVRLMLNTLICALSGNYVNFGVFSLYNDQALQNALDVSLQLCLQIPLADVLAYVKLSKAYFGYLEILFRNHLDVLSGLDSTVFLQLVRCNQDGLQSSDLTICASCANTIDHLATYMFLNQNKEKPTVQMIRAHIAQEPDVLSQLMTNLFNALLFTPHANHWAITRPILSLLLTSESSFTEYQAQLINSQTNPENQEKLREEFTKLTADIQRSVEVTNRDKFTQKLTMFRLNVRSFLSL